MIYLSRKIPTKNNQKITKVDVYCPPLTNNNIPNENPFNLNNWGLGFGGGSHNSVNTSQIIIKDEDF